MEEIKTDKKSRPGGYRYVVPVQRRAGRRGEAEARQKAYDKLSTSDKIKRAKGSPGESKRELARLEARLEREKLEAKHAKALAKTEKKPRKVSKES